MSILQFTNDFLRVLCLSALWVSANAAQHAVIVGVAEYPYLSKDHQLIGPRNDARLLQAYFDSRGFSDEQIVVLSDEQPESYLPTKQNIFRVLDERLAQLSRGDFLYLHFSGHGSQQPAKEGDEEIDGMTEIFLPRDTREWDGDTGTVTNAITDDEVAEYLAAFKQKGVFVWLVFDSCHSGTMSRNTWKSRKVSPSTLGIPKTRSTIGFTREANVLEAATEGGYIAFFAAQTTEETPEMKLPKRSQSPLIYGLFTHHLINALRQAPTASYRQIADQVVQNYMAQPWYGSSPMFVGDDMDQPVFQGQANSTVRQWPLYESETGWRIPAGYLHGLQVGAELLILKKPTDPDDSEVGRVIISAVGPLESQMESVGSTNVPERAFARLVDTELQLGLNLALLENDTFPMSAKTKRLLGSMPNDSGIYWTGRDESTDMQLLESQGQLVLVTDGEPLPCVSRKPCQHQKEYAKVSLAGSDAAIKRRLLEMLAKTAKAINLLRLGSVLTLDGLETRLNVTRLNSGKKEQFDRSDVPELYSGDTLSLTIANYLDDPLDITVLFVGSDYSIDVVFPRRGGFNRFMEEEERTIPLGQINTQTTGMERLVIIASRAKRTSAPASYAFLSQVGVQRTRSNLTPLGGLLTEAGFGRLRTTRTRSAAGGESLADDSDIHTLAWITRKKK